MSSQDSSRLPWLGGAHRRSPWEQARVLVAGLGSAGFASADAMLEAGAQVIVVDENDSDATFDKATLLEHLDASVRIGPGVTDQLPTDIDLVITSPGWRPNQPLLTQAAAAGIPIWGDVELAWRFMHPDRVVPWLGVTGTNGKTTTTQMLDSMLRAAGLKSAAVGNIGRPIIEAINDEIVYDVFAVELSSFQLHWAPSLKLHSAAVLNLQPDHLEWYDDWTGDPYAAYGADKARIYHDVSHSCVYNVSDLATEQMVVDAEVQEGARAIGFTLGIPAVSMVGVVEDLIVDRAFVKQRQTAALPLADLSDVQPFAPHNVENALAAAALARSFEVPAAAVGAGLQNLQLGGHRIQQVAEHGGVSWVDDSKATNPHAANSSLRAYPNVVWIAGGQTKGTSFDELIEQHRDRLRAAILLGVDRQQIADALTRHAPDVPVVIIDDRETGKTGAMGKAVQAAAQFAQPGDTVLLAPGAASKDMWSGYEARGDDFAAAVQDLTNN